MILKIYSKRYVLFFWISAWLLLSALPAKGQQKYWIYFSRENNLNAYRGESSFQTFATRFLKEQGIPPIIHSEWLHASSVIMSDMECSELAGFPGIDSIRPANTNWKILGIPGEDPSMEQAIEQINGLALRNAGYTGKGIKIGIIDAGFYRADKQKDLASFFEQNRIRAYRNYIEPEENDPYSKAKFSDFHGTRVWQFIGGYHPERNRLSGLATDAEFYLARTDEDAREYRGEEDYWIAAVEWMHNQGVRVINSSLGYSDGHDDPAEDYLPEQADGKSSALTRAAEIAVKEKGMLIIMSAGNSGGDDFGVVNIPADAPGIIAVGATRLNYWTRQRYSSYGKFTFPNVKPDVSCYAALGTSFAAPVITGMAACILEADSTLTNYEVMDLIRSSSHLSGFPNNFLGYGVPDAGRILTALNENSSENNAQRFGTLVATSDSVKVNYPNGKFPVVFHKSDHINVYSQETLNSSEGIWWVRRPSGNILFSTFTTPDMAIEITWPSN